MIELTLNEFETLIKKIIYSDRHNWGEAIEIASSLKRLAGYQLPLCHLFLDYQKRSKAKSECTFNHAMRLNDFYYVFEDQQKITLDCPIFVIPWIESIAIKLNKTIKIEWEKTKLHVGNHCLEMIDAENLYSSKSEQLVLSFVKEENRHQETALVKKETIQLSTDDYTQLYDQANEMNVPINEKSEKDAGSFKLDDNF